MNPYEVLGVEPNASEIDIDRVYRTEVRRCHPDHHPNDPVAAERFKQLAEAYEILCDTARRRQYDATGDTSPRSTIDQMATALIGKLFCDLIKMAVRDGADPRMDLVAILRAKLQLEMKNSQKDVKETQEYIERCETIANRLKGKDGEHTLLADLARAPIPQLQHHLKQSELEVQVALAAIKVLQNYRCETAKSSKGRNPGSSDYSTSLDDETLETLENIFAKFRR